MNNIESKYLEIRDLDGNAQGVTYLNNKITFVSKVLPGEHISAQVIHQTSKYQIAQVTHIHQESPIRVTPNCPHYQNCPGCHYLHTNYQEEVKFKLQGLLGLFHRAKMAIPPQICVVGAKNRKFYRNRIQLHYDLTIQSLGYLTRQGEIVSVPQCHLPISSVAQTIEKLYQNKTWLQMIPKNSPKKGHLEIYQRPDAKHDKVSLSWNQPYSHGGFTQANVEASAYLSKIVKDFSQTPKQDSKLIELFCGKGDLTRDLGKQWHIWGFDRHVGSSSHPGFQAFPCDLYSKDHLTFIKQRLGKHLGKTPLLLLDPPRSGHRGLYQDLEALEIQHCLYISCNATTMLRDISQIMKTYPCLWVIKRLYLVDLFPGTHHYETCCILEKVQT